MAIKNFKVINNKLKVSRITKKIFDYYQNHFKEFIKNDFNDILKAFRTALRNIFMQKDIYVRRYNINFVTALANIVT